MGGIHRRDSWVHRGNCVALGVFLTCPTSIDRAYRPLGLAYTFDRLQPAARASASVQNQRSP